MRGPLTASTTLMVRVTGFVHHLTSTGNTELLWQIGLNMQLDSSSLETREGFQEFLFLSQARDLP